MRIGDSGFGNIDQVAKTQPARDQIARRADDGRIDGARLERGKPLALPDDRGIVTSLSGRSCSRSKVRRIEVSKAEPNRADADLQHGWRPIDFTAVVTATSARPRAEISVVWTRIPADSGTHDVNFFPPVR